MRYSKYARRRAQLNAISRSYTAKTQKEARTYLESIGIDYEQYCLGNCAGHQLPLKLTLEQASL